MEAMETSKRKHADDFHHQAKKPRIANHDAGFGMITEGSSTAEASENIDVFPSSFEIEMPYDMPSDCSMDEKAIVLYKPANPELFMSKSIPRALTIQLDPRFFTAGILGPEYLSASDTLKQLGVLRTTPAGPDLASVGVTSRVDPDNRFALIPWVASSTNMFATGIRFPSTNETATSQLSSETLNEDEEMGEVALESEAMNEDDGVDVIPSSQPSNPINNFGTEPWQHYGLPQSHFGSVTWSH
eukprot:c1412_g1_i1 orf=65-793(+)